MIAPEVAKVTESLPITGVILAGENAVISDEASSVESNKQYSYSFGKKKSTFLVQIEVIKWYDYPNDEIWKEGYRERR